MKSKPRLRHFLLALLPPLLAVGLHGAIKITADHPTGVYALGETVTWTIDAAGEPSASAPFAYTIKKDGQLLLAEGTLDLAKGVATLSATASDASSVLLQLTAPADKNKPLAAGGAIFAPEKIGPAAPAPADFDAFWKAKLEELSQVPAKPVLEKVAGVKNADALEYYKVTLDNIRDTKVRGQLARPVAGEKFPAIVTFQFAGVYALDPNVVINDAKLGYLALNISAHDLPIDEKPEFYATQKEGALKNYIYIGSEDRETSYFLRMFLGCVRAIDYLASRPDWDGKVLLVTGASQGGLQSFAAAGLNPKVTGLMVGVPAGCDNYAPRAGRAFGWPYWVSNWGPRDRDMAKVEATAGYFDAINFAARTRCPALVAYGLVDTTSRPTGVAAAINALAGPKEAIILPLSDHHGSGSAQRAYFNRAAEWKRAARSGPFPPSGAAR